MFKKLILALAAVLSIGSQVLLYLPARFSSIPGPVWDLFAFLFFVASMILFIDAVFSHT
jgi:hypothetical protein